ncbi:hypothetical protein M9Y10_002083 [Tritrichomonas musculus]|uniref:Uncharacterized protein n=1 Tax=Tritrichomonas musculus TaxID=1915356 RepID=A0ABR2GNM7_9EUKA
MEIPLPKPGDTNYVQEFCKMLNDKYIEIISSGKEIDSNLIFQFYNFADNAHRPEYISESEWNYLRTNIYLFLSTLDPKEDQIPGISLKTDDGVLFSSIVIQYCIRKNNKVFADTLVQAFDFIIDTIVNRDKPVSIYSYSPSFYARNLPKLLSNSLPEEVYKKIFVDTLRRFINKKNKYLTDSDLAFYSEIIRILLEKEDLSQELCVFFCHLYENYKHIPIQIVNHFLNLWRGILPSIKSSNDKDITELPSNILLTVSKLKAHDLPRSFPWHICFQIYESLLSSPKNQFKVFIAINSIIRNIKRIDITNRIDSLAQLFFRVMKTQFTKGGEKEGYHLLYYFLTNVISTVSLATQRLKPLKGIQLKHTGSTRISFAKQPQDGENVVDLDNGLYTQFVVVECKTGEEEIRQFDSMKKTIDSLSKQLQFAIKFNVIEPFRIFDLMDLPNQSDRIISEPTISLIYYLRLIIRSWLDFLVSFSFRVTMMNHYLFQGDGLLKFNGPGPTIRRQVDYTLLHREVIDSLLALPDELTSLIVDELIRCLAKSLKKEMITHHVIINFFSSLCQKKPLLKRLLLTKMIPYSISALPKLTSNDNRDSHFYNQWIMLFFRIGMKANRPDPNFLYVLLNSQKLIISNVINYMRQITNATETMETFNWFRLMMYESAGSKPLVVSDQDMLKVRRHLLDELPAASHHNALRIIFDPIMTSSKQTLTISLMSSLLTEAFNSKDQAVISMALRQFVPLLMKESIQKFCDFEFDKYQNLFSSLFNSAIYANEADFNTIYHIIPSMAPFFIKKPTGPTTDPFQIIFEPFGLTVKEVIQSINKTINDDESESVHLFNLYVHLFNKTKECFYLNPAKSFETLSSLLTNIVNLYKFNEIRAQVFDFLLNQNIEFAKHMIQTHINTYFLILFSVIGFSRSYMSKYTIDLIHNFLSVLKDMNVEDSVISDTMNDILSSSNISISHFNIFIGLGLIYKHFPKVITISHIGRLFSTTSENIQHDMKNLPLLNKFLKLFLTNGTDEIKRQFTEIIYQRFHMIWYGYRFMITNQLSKLGAKLPLKSYNELNSIENNTLFILKTIVAFACGINGNETESLSEDMKSRIRKIIQGLDTSQTQHGFESKVIVLIIYFSIVSNEIIRHEFMSDYEFVETMFMFLKRMIIRRLPILFRASKKLFKTVFQSCDTYPFISSIIDKFYTNEPTNFLGSNVLLSFVLHLTRIVPHKCPPSFTKIIIETIINFSRKSNEDQMNFFPAFVCLLKLLVIEDYIKQKDVLDIYRIQKNQHSYYFHLLNALIRLCQNDEIPYLSLIGSQLMKLFLIFPEETINFIIFKFNDIQCVALSVIENIILKDTSYILLHAFVKAIENHLDKISSIRPCVYETLANLFKHEEVISNQKTRDFGIFLFNQFTSEYNSNLIYGLHGFMSLIHLSKIYLIVLKHDLTYENIFSFSKIFQHPSFRSSNIYKKFIHLVFIDKEQAFYKGLLEYTLQLLYFETNDDIYFIEIIISHSIKHITDESEEYQSFLWNEVDKMAIDMKYNTIRLKIISRMFEMTNIYNLNKVELVIKNIPLIFGEPIPQHIFIGYKITQSLQKHDKLPDKLFSHLISMFIRYGKYLDTPYAYSTMQLMKSRPDLFMNLDMDLKKSFLFFTLEKLPFLKDLPKIVFAVQAGPKFLEYLPFPVVLNITNSVEKKMKKIMQQSSNFNPNNSKLNSSIESYLNCAIKISSYSQPSNEILKKLYDTCFQYLIFVSNLKLRVKDFPDIFCQVLLKYGCEEFSFDFLNLVAQAETKEKYYFYFIACASKFLTNSQIMTYHDLFINSISSIPIEHYKSNYVATLIQGITRNEELWSLFSHAIDGLLFDLTRVINESNIEIIITVIQTIFKSDLKMDKIQYIEKLWVFIDGLTETPHLKQIYKFIMSFIDDIPPHLQEYYYSLIKAHSRKTKKHNEALISTSQIFMKCQNVRQTIKLDFVKHMNEYLDEYAIETLERLLETYDEYSESNEIDLSLYKLPIYFHLMLHSTHNKSVIFAEIIMNSLGMTIKERFINAYKLFPLSIWRDNQIAATSILFFGKVNGWQPMIVFSKSFITVGSKIFRNLLEQLENDEESLIVMKNLYISLIPFNDCKSANEALISILSNKKVNMSLIVSGCERWNQTLLLNDDTNLDLIPDIMFLPHVLNDSLFSRYRSSNSYTMAAECHFFLGNYEEAMKIFQANECSLNSPFDSRIFKLTQILTQNDEFEYFSRFYYTNDRCKAVVSKLYESFLCCQREELHLARNNLKETAHLFYLFNKEKKEKTLYERDFSDTIQFIMYHLEKVADENSNNVELSPFPVYYSNLAFSPFYQSLFKEINRDLLFKLDPDDKIPEILVDDDQNPLKKQSVILTPGIEKMFRFVNGYDAHGYSSVNVLTILEYSRHFISTITNSEPSEKVEYSINYVNIHRWACLCFSLFTIFKTPTMLSAAFNSYVKLLSVSEFVPYFIKFESSARIITLLRLGLADSQNEEYRNVCEKVSNKLASPEFESKREILQFWIRQVVELQSFKPFAQILSNKMEEYIGLSTAYSMGKITFDEIIQAPMKDETVRSQLNTLHLFEEVINYIFSMKFEEFQVQVILESLFYEMRNSEADIENLDLVKVRDKQIKSSLEQNIYLLPLGLVERLNNESNLVQKIKRSTPSEIYELVEYYLPSSFSTYEINKRELYRLIDELNNNMPLPFPTRISNNVTPYLIFLQYNIKKINDSLFVFTFKTSVMKNHTFIVQKNENYTEQQKCTTFSSFLLLLKQINRYNYSNRVRSIRYSTYLGSDVGQQYSIYAIATMPLNLEEIFEMWSGEKSSKWTRNTDEIPDDILLKHLTFCYTKEEFLKNQELLVRSASASFLIDHLFLANYPSMETMMICPQLCEIPILFKEITANYHEKDFSTFRLSPNIKRGFGPFYKGKMIISMASSANSIFKFIESTNSFIELLICEELNDELNIDSMVEMKNRINHEILKFVPPASLGSTPKDSANWIEYIDSVIEKAGDASFQPVERFPWF